MDLLYGTEINLIRKTTLNADIVNRKLTRVLLNLPVNKHDNLDIISHTIESKRYLTNSSFNSLDAYVRKGVYELTGISYTEFKSMSMIEKRIFNIYLNHKVDISSL